MSANDHQHRHSSHAIKRDDLARMLARKEWFHPTSSDKLIRRPVTLTRWQGWLPETVGAR